MKTYGHILTIAFTLMGFVFLSNTYAGPEITGIPRGPVDKEKIEKARLAARLCGPGWTLSDDREHTRTSFLCVPVKLTVQCPPNSQVLETPSSIGCMPRESQ